VDLCGIAIPLHHGGKHKEKIPQKPQRKKNKTHKEKISLRHDRRHKENSREKCSMWNPL
jgi:2-methylcitrate dehydratase PrpD